MGSQNNGLITSQPHTELRTLPILFAFFTPYIERSASFISSSIEEATGWTEDPREKLMAFFQALGKYVNDPQCYGCPHLNVSVEYPQAGYSGHKIALAHKLSVWKRFQELAESAGAQDPEELANQLVLLMDGAYMAARVYGANNPGSSVAKAAKTLVDAS